MKPPYDASYYDDLRGRVRGILILLGDRLTLEQQDLLDELLNANEPGVALEMMIGMLERARSTIDACLAERMLQLVQTMKLDPNVRMNIQFLRRESGDSQADKDVD